MERPLTRLFAPSILLLKDLLPTEVRSDLNSHITLWLMNSYKFTKHWLVIRKRYSVLNVHTTSVCRRFRLVVAAFYYTSLRLTGSLAAFTFWVFTPAFACAFAEHLLIRFSSEVAVKVSRRRPTFPHSCPCSIIDAEKLDCRVRNGNGYFLLAKSPQIV